MVNKKLQPEVAAKYRLLTIRPGKHNFADFGLIDLRTLKLSQADELFKKGFPFFQLKENIDQLAEAGKKAAKAGNKLANAFIENNLKSITANEPKDIPPPVDIKKYQADKNLVNDLLAKDWKDLDFPQKLIFFNDETYFLGKKSRMIQNGDHQQQMVGVHAKMKAIDPDPKFDQERADCMTELKNLDDLKKENWLFVDTWEDPNPIQSTDPKVIAQQAVEKDRLIKAHNNYIWRYEKILDQMPVETEKERVKKQKRIDEIAKRRKALEDFGVPYIRKSRTNESS